MRNLNKADEELANFFTASVGVKAQVYDHEGGPSCFDGGSAHAARLEACKRGTLAWFDAVAKTVRATPSEHRRVLELVYIPVGSPGFLGVALAPPPLPGALPPQNGETPTCNGSFVGLAMASGLATEAYQKRFPGKPATRLDVLQFLSDEAGTGGKSEPFFTKMKRACAEPWMVALLVYDDLRIARCRLELARKREQKLKAESDSRILLDNELGRSAKRRTDRFNAMLGRHT